MPSSASTAELRKMTPAELEREILEKRAHMAKIRLGVEMRHEKDTAKLRVARREIACMLTVLRQKRAMEPVSGLKAKASEGTVPASRTPRAPKKRTARRSHLSK